MSGGEGDEGEGTLEEGGKRTPQLLVHAVNDAGEDNGRIG